MGGFVDFFLGKDEKPSGPHQGPQFANQEQLLSNVVMGNMLSQNPYLFGKSGMNYGLTGNPNTSMWQAYQGKSGPSFSWGGGQPGGNSYSPGTKVLSMPQSWGQSGGGQAQWAPQQMTYQAPQTNFTQRNPYQYQQPQALSVPNIYAPQYNMARQDIMDQGARTEEQILADLNRRGMLTSGATNKAMMDLTRERDNRLADLSSQYSIEQGRMGLQEQQMRRQMEMERQYQQAAEIFRQQGASDEQAKFLAQQSLAGFGANLDARKAYSAEEQLANLYRRQPLEDLFKLYGMQTGTIGGTQAQQGLIPSLVSAGAGAAAQYGMSMI